jgi:anti-sigma B factor antagonist
MALGLPDERLVSAAERFEIRVQPDREVIYVEPVGELDLANAPELRQQIVELLGAGFERVVIDLRRLSFIDLRGVQLLLSLAAEAQRDGWLLSLIQGPVAVHRIFLLTSVVDRLPFVSAPALAASWSEKRRPSLR